MEWKDREAQWLKEFEDNRVGAACPDQAPSEVRHLGCTRIPRHSGPHVAIGIGVLAWWHSGDPVVRALADLPALTPEPEPEEAPVRRGSRCLLVEPEPPKRFVPSDLVTTPEGWVGRVWKVSSTSTRGQKCTVIPVHPYGGDPRAYMASVLRYVRVFVPPVSAENRRPSRLLLLS